MALEMGYKNIRIGIMNGVCNVYFFKVLFVDLYINARVASQTVGNYQRTTACPDIEAVLFGNE